MRNGLYAEWNPASDFFGLDRLLGDLRPSVKEAELTPACDIGETESHFWLSVDLPGVKQDQIKIEFENGELLITAERKPESIQGSTRHLLERATGVYRRSFSLNVPVDSDHIEAAYQEGVLRVAIPKAESARPRQIKVGEATPGGFFKKADDKEKTEKTLN